MCDDASTLVASVGSVCLRQDTIRYTFGFLCLICGLFGTILTIRAGNASISAIPPELVKFPDPNSDPVFERVLERGERFFAARKASLLNNVGIVILYCSVVTGLVINFPTLITATIGIVVTLSVTAYAVFEYLRIPTLQVQQTVWKLLQEMGRAINGNVVSQNAAAQLENILNEDIRTLKVGIPILRTEIDRIVERNAEREQLRIRDIAAAKKKTEGEEGTSLLS